MSTTGTDKTKARYYKIYYFFGVAYITAKSKKHAVEHFKLFYSNRIILIIKEP